MDKITLSGSWGNLYMTGFEITLDKNQINILYGDELNHIYLTYQYQQGSSFSMFEKYARIQKEKIEMDFIIDGNNFGLYVDDKFTYNLALEEDMCNLFFKDLNQSLGINFKEMAISTWESIIKHR